MAHALRAVVARAGTTRVGFPTRVVELDEPGDACGRCAPSVRIDFSHARGTARVCPVSHMEHESNHFFVTIGIEDERTGLPAFFVYCHSLKDCNADKKRRMLTFVDPTAYDALGVTT
jgi:hypothetical protein